MAATAVTSSPSAFAVFRNRNFTLLWSAQFVSTIGSSLASLAASILIFRETNSALSVGLMLMATALPSIVLGLVAGVFVDRLDRKRIMIGADLLRAVIVFSIPFFVQSNLVWLYVLVLLESAVGQFFEPAQSSVLPEVATDEELAAANSLMAISSFGATAVGFGAAGLLASQFSLEWSFYIDALSFIFSAVCIALVRIAPLTSVEDSSVAAIFQNMRSGFQFLFRTPILRSTFILLPVLGISFGLANTLLLPFAREALGATEFEYGLQEALTSMAFVVGSLLMARVADKRPEGQWIAFSFLGMGIADAIYSQLSSVAVAFIFVMISGFANAPWAVIRNVILQRNSPREMRGRVASSFYVVRDVSFLVGMAAAGLADIVGVRQMYLASALIVFVAGLLALVLPGLGQTTVEWRRAVQAMRGAPSAPRLGAGRAATLADVDALALRFGPLATLSDTERKQLAASGRVVDAPAGTTIVAKGEKSDAAYFILDGTALAGVPNPDGSYNSLETMGSGDFFGEIAALSGQPRTANVVATEPITLLQIPSAELHHLMEFPQISQIVRTKFIERLSRTNLNELPRFAGFDQALLRELRTTLPEEAA